jgi:hypothetical protein
LGFLFVFILGDVLSPDVSGGFEIQNYQTKTKLKNNKIV